MDIERQVKSLEDYIFEEQESIDDLYEFAEAIYIVESVDVDYEKNCIINQCNVIQTIKGEKRRVLNYTIYQDSGMRTM